jgi:hypothetical protein
MALTLKKKMNFCRAKPTQVQEQMQLKNVRRTGSFDLSLSQKVQMLTSDHGRRASLSHMATTPPGGDGRLPPVNKTSGSSSPHAGADMRSSAVARAKGGKLSTLTVSVPNEGEGRLQAGSSPHLPSSTGARLGIFFIFFFA